MFIYFYATLGTSVMLKGSAAQSICSGVAIKYSHINH